MRSASHQSQPFSPRRPTCRLPSHRHGPASCSSLHASESRPRAPLSQLLPGPFSPQYGAVQDAPSRPLPRERLPARRLGSAVSSPAVYTSCPASTTCRHHHCSRTPYSPCCSGRPATRPNQAYPGSVPLIAAVVAVPAALDATYAVPLRRLTSATPISSATAENGPRVAQGRHSRQVANKAPDNAIRHRFPPGATTKHSDRRNRRLAQSSLPCIGRRVDNAAGSCCRARRKSAKELNRLSRLALGKTHCQVTGDRSMPAAAAPMAPCVTPL